MTPERFEEVERVCQAALDQPAHLRAGFLDEACKADAELRAEVESLLAGASSAEKLLATPPLVPPLPLAVGQRLGAYEIAGEIGAGGMGAVYRARDTRLGRTVAIKVIAGAAVIDAATRDRFTREARLVASLNHPHICAVHDVGREGDHDFLVMEYVDGESLDRVMRHRRLRIDETLRYAIEIADGLAHAHAAGIVHRDLKPSNVMIDGHGRVKLLDFGLAKLIGADHPRSGAQTSTTALVTAPGSVVGTAAYMSPEQAEGQAVDARSDVFSFGAVLYEMLTGRRAFPGDSVASTLAAVLKEQPRPLREVVPGVPSDLDRLVMRCLQKDVDRRWQTMLDLPVLLREILDEHGVPPAEGDGPVRTHWRRRWIVGAAGLLLAATGGTLFWMSIRERLPPPAIRPLTTYSGSETSPSFSPDGSQVAFAWEGERGDNRDIYVKLLGEIVPRALTSDPATDEWPAWAPDGERIAFQRTPAGGPTQVIVMSALGGAEHKLGEFPALGPMSWSADGQWLAFAEREGGLSMLSSDGRDRRALTNPAAPRYHLYPAFSPDGRWLAYAEGTQLWNYGEVFIMPLGSDGLPRGAPRQVTRLGLTVVGLTWSRDSASVLFGAGFTLDTPRYLWRAWLDPKRQPERLDIGGDRAAFPAVALAGDRLAFSRELADFDIWRYSAGGTLDRLITSSLLEVSPQFSPDGRFVAFASARTGGTSEIWIAHADGSNPRQLTDRVGAYQGTPRWSPDGRWIAFDSRGHDGTAHVWIVEATGGPPRRLTADSHAENVPAWSHDGRWVYYRSNRTGTREIWRVPFAGGDAEQVTRNGALIASESEDGKDLYYVKTDPSPLFVVPVAGGPERQIPISVGNRGFVVRKDGIYYLSRTADDVLPIGARGQRGDGNFYRRATRNGGDSLCLYDFATRQSRTIIHIDGPLYLGLTVSPDRKSFLFSRSTVSGSDLMLIENFR
jgi:serine/threonine protein kinase/Tol biopolymer transport system component